MLHLKTLLILAFAFLIMTYFFKRAKEQSIFLTTSVMFLFSIFLFIGLIELAHSLTDNGTLTSFTALDTLISFNVLSTKIRNSAMIVGLAAISYGLYDQNSLRKNKLLLYTSYLVAGITLILIILMTLAGGFTI